MADDSIDKNMHHPVKLICYYQNWLKTNSHGLHAVMTVCFLI
jgi:hypothetical protein